MVLVPSISKISVVKSFETPSSEAQLFPMCFKILGPRGCLWSTSHPTARTQYGLTRTWKLRPCCSLLSFLSSFSQLFFCLPLLLWTSMSVATEANPSPDTCPKGLALPLLSLQRSRSLIWDKACPRLPVSCPALCPYGFVSGHCLQPLRPTSAIQAAP